jgi:hypothetical protein
MSEPSSSSPAVIDRDVEKLHPKFRLQVARLLEALRRRGYHPFIFEAFRSTERQKWLFAQGRTRDLDLPKVTKCDGVENKSRHQAGLAADIWFIDSKGRKECPPAKDDRWYWLREDAEALGLVSGASFGDMPHVEAPKKFL